MVTALSNKPDILWYSDRPQFQLQDFTVVKPTNTRQIIRTRTTRSVPLSGFVKEKTEKKNKSLHRR